jgi:hypothetical protein
MTVGVPALNKLKQAGVGGVIVGSLSEADIRRFLASGSSREARQGQFWTSRNHASRFAPSGDGAPFVIVVTEGFGRIPMAETVFDFLRENEGSSASVMAMTSIGADLRRPEIYIAGRDSSDGSRPSDELLPGRAVRLVSGRALGTVGMCSTTVYQQRSNSGVVTDVVDIRLQSGESRRVAVNNLEVLT